MIKIVNQPTRKLPTFGSLKVGDTFIKDKVLYVATYDFEDNEENFNAMGLMENDIKFKWFDEDEEVEPVDINIEIKCKGETA